MSGRALGALLGLVLLGLGLCGCGGGDSDPFAALDEASATSSYRAASVAFYETAVDLAENGGSPGLLEGPTLRLVSEAGEVSDEGVRGELLDAAGVAADAGCYVCADSLRQEADRH